MGLDALFIRALSAEINAFSGAKVDKIYMPDKNEVVLWLRRAGTVRRLLLSCTPGYARAHFTEFESDNPQNPPMMCMLLRRHLSGARLKAAEQPRADRLLKFVFEAYSELGEPCEKSLVLEMIGSAGNIVFCDADGRIIEAARRVESPEPSRRRIMPGVAYEPPPPQAKLDPFQVGAGDLAKIVRSAPSERLEKALLGAIAGLSPIVCRELAYLSARNVDVLCSQMGEEQIGRLWFHYGRMLARTGDGSAVPVLVFDPSCGAPVDFSFMEIGQYGATAATKKYPDLSSLLDAFYSERARLERIRRRSLDMLKVISSAVERVSRRLGAQRSELAESERCEELRQAGLLINSNLHLLRKGMDQAELDNFFEEGCPKLLVRLDPSLTPVQNAQRYFKRYAKAKAAKTHLARQIELGSQELEYLESVFDSLARAESENDLAEIRQELIEGGYMKPANKPAPVRVRTRQFSEYVSSDGFVIYAGRNNRQNDALTMKTARAGDIWLHARNMPGSHVIIVAKDARVPDRTIAEAAAIAAYCSKARGSAKVPVDYTLAKHVKKPPGAKPGMVTYSSFKTVFVDPDEKLIKKLAKQDSPGSMN